MRFYLFILLQLMLTAAQAQSLRIELSAGRIYRDGNVQVSYTVDGTDESADFGQPAFREWKVLSGPMYSQEQSIVNGVSHSKVSSVYLLSPLKSGKIPVPGATARVGARVLSCAPAMVEVEPGKDPSGGNSTGRSSPNNMLPGFPNLPPLFDEVPQARPLAEAVLKPGQRPEDLVRKNVFVRVTASKKQVFAGEPVLITYELFTAIRSRSRVYKQPGFAGCSVVEMPIPEGSEERMAGGRPFRVFTIRKVQLTPLQTGDLVLEPAYIDNEAEIEDASGNTTNFSLRISNNPEKLTVLPLPAAGRPADFRGPVGHFSVSAKVRDTEVGAGENNTLVLTVQGQGSMSALPLPAIGWPAGTEHFDDSSQEDINRTVFPMTGAKTFEVPFIAHGKKGDRVTIGPVTFSYFDPASGKYETASSEPVSVLLLAAGTQVHPQEIIRDDSASRKWLWLVPVIAMIVIGIWLLQRKSSDGTAKTEDIPKSQPAIDELSPAEALPVVKPAAPDPLAAVDMLSHLEEGPLFFTQVRQVLLTALRRSLEQPASNAPELTDTLAKRDPLLAAGCREIFSRCDTALYSGMGMGPERAELLEKLPAILKALS